MVSLWGITRVHNESYVFGGKSSYLIVGLVFTVWLYFWIDLWKVDKKKRITNWQWNLLGVKCEVMFTENHWKRSTKPWMRHFLVRLRRRRWLTEASRRAARTIHCKFSLHTNRPRPTTLVQLPLTLEVTSPLSSCSPGHCPLDPLIMRRPPPRPPPACSGECLHRLGHRLLEKWRAWAGRTPCLFEFRACRQRAGHVT